MKRHLLWAGLALGVGGLLADGCIARRAFALTQIARQRAASQTEKTAETVRIVGLQVSVWRPNHAGPAPLVIFSHGFHGSSTQSVFLMKSLADDGYLVLAPNHKDAGFGSRQPQQPFSKAEVWSDATYQDRAQDITSLLAGLKKDPAWSGAIDWSRVALAGHSLGGYTVLGLAGGWSSWKVPGIKAVLALSPFCTPFIEKKTLRGISVPVMYQGGTLDVGITPSVKRTGGAYDQTPSPAVFVDFQGAGHLAWTDLRATDHDSIVAYSEEFLDKYVKGQPVGFKKRSDVTDLRTK